MDGEKVRGWYVVHTYSGYENKVKADLEKTIINRNLQDMIDEVVVPVENVTEIRNGKSKNVEHKLFPGYVLINMTMNDDIWYIIRNTRGVTGFVGPEPTKPVPLTDEEIAALGMGEKKIVSVDYEVGDEVVVVSDAWKNTAGVISNISMQKQTVTIMVDVFGRETPLELAFTEVRKKQAQA